MSTSEELRAAVVASAPATMRGVAADLQSAGWRWEAGSSDGGDTLAVRGRRGALVVEAFWARNPKTGGHSRAGSLIWDPADAVSPRSMSVAALREAIRVAAPC